MDQVILVLLVCVGCILAAGLITFFYNLARDVRFIKLEISRASNAKEVQYWKKELRVLYLSAIPGVSVRKAREIVNRRKK